MLKGPVEPGHNHLPQTKIMPSNRITRHTSNSPRLAPGVTGGEKSPAGILRRSTRVVELAAVQRVRGGGPG